MSRTGCVPVVAGLVPLKIPLGHIGDSLLVVEDLSMCHGVGIGHGHDPLSGRRFILLS